MPIEHCSLQSVISLALDRFALPGKSFLLLCGPYVQLISYWLLQRDECYFVPLVVSCLPVIVDVHRCHL